MRWISHQTGALLGAAFLGMPVPAIGAACVGAILPDMLDQKISGLAPTKKTRQKVFNRIHRGPSHWFGWWLAIFLLPLAMPFAMNDLAAGLGFGALSHVCLDMLTRKGIPLFPFGSFRLGLGLCSTGKASEYVFLAGMICAGFFYFGPDILIFFQKMGLLAA